MNIIPIGFMKTYDIHENSLEGEKFDVKEQEKNSELLIELKRQAPSNVQIFSSEIAI